MTAATGPIRTRCAPRADFRLVFRPATQPGTLACWLAVPERADPAARPLVAIHGIRRAADEQAAMFAARSAALGCPVVAPLFDTESWPTYQRLGAAHRADLALLDLLRQLQGECIVRAGQLDLFGFSAGAQFAHRFAMLHPHLIGHLTVASAGWYTFPDAATYPYGLGAQAGRTNDCGTRMQAGLDGFLRLPIRVCVGDKDNVRDRNTRKGDAIDRQQGRDRRARAARWAAALVIAAATRSIVPRIKLSVLRGVGHDFRECMSRGGLADLVFRDQEDAAPLKWLPERCSSEAVSHPPGNHAFATTRYSKQTG